MDQQSNPDDQDEQNLKVPDIVKSFQTTSVYAKFIRVGILSSISLCILVPFILIQSNGLIDVMDIFNLLLLTTLFLASMFLLMLKRMGIREKIILLMMMFLMSVSAAYNLLNILGISIPISFVLMNASKFPWNSLFNITGFVAFVVTLIMFYQGLGNKKNQLDTRKIILNLNKLRTEMNDRFDKVDHMLDGGKN